MKYKGIGAIFTLLLLVQASYILAFSFKEGFSSLTLLAFGMAAIPILLLWGIFFLLGRTRTSILNYLITGFIFCILFEVILPVSPIKSTVMSMVKQRAVDHVQITNVSDKFFYSARGNPIGIRIEYTASFPFGGALHVSPTLWPVAAHDHHPLTSMSHFAGISIEPEPGNNSSGAYVFAKGQSYRFTADFLPGFIFLGRHDSKNLKKDEICLYEKDTQTITRQEFRRLVTGSTETRYRVEISASGGSYFVKPRVAYSGPTRNAYSLKVFYESAVQENAGPCNF